MEDNLWGVVLVVIVVVVVSRVWSETIRYKYIYMMDVKCIERSAYSLTLLFILILILILFVLLMCICISP